MIRPVRSGALALIIASILAGAFSSAFAQDGGAQRVIVRSAQIPFDPSDPDRRKFGALTYLGGIEVQSSSKRFGGLSGLVVSPDGRRFTAVTDIGEWVRGGIQYKDGAIFDLVRVMMARIRGVPGESMRRKFDRDAEGLAAMSPDRSDGRFLVTFERRHRIAVYDLSSAGTGPRYLTLPAEAADFDDNKGLEAVGLFPPGGPLAGSIIVMAEHYLNDDGNHGGWLIKGDRVERFFLKRSDYFDLTALTILPSGDVVILERRYSPFFGPSMRLRRIKAAAIRPGALLDGEVLLEASQPLSVDNMEGISWHRANDGRLVLTIVSDDNFRSAQRTLLLQFEIQE